MRRDRDIAATDVVPAARGDVFAFLADLENHWRLADRFVEVLDLDRGPGGAARGGRVRVRGPVGLRRTVATRVLATEPPATIAGTAEAGGGTRAVVCWELESAQGGTRVRLRIALERAGPLDRALLALGGRAWMRVRLRRILRRLGEEVRAERLGPALAPRAQPAAGEA